MSKDSLIGLPRVSGLAMIVGTRVDERGTAVKHCEVDECSEKREAAVCVE